jgi:hypothetical protein
LIRDNLSKEQSLKDMINGATEILKKKNSLSKVPPIGSGV